MAVEEAVWAELLVRYGRWLGACGRWRQVFFWVMSCNGFGLSWVREREAGGAEWAVFFRQIRPAAMVDLWSRDTESVGWFMVLIRKMRESLCMMVVGSFCCWGQWRIYRFTVGMEACNDLLVLIWWLERMGMKAWFVGVVSGCFAGCAWSLVG